MPPLLAIRCERCDFRQDIVPRIQRTYEIIGGSRVTVHSRIAYCLSCSKVVDAELLPEIESIEARIERIVQGDEDEDIKYIERNRDEWAGYHRGVLQWRLNRSDPPKCLECGTVDIGPIDEPWNFGAKTTSVVECPDCGDGVLSAQVNGIVRVRDDRVSIYSANGDFLRTEAVELGARSKSNGENKIR